ncbi:MAG: hypothetical protein JJT77_10130 [Crocinitomicaceae bacterium]|nr:hypothetical protein [Crocinitomicaceae bacterium]
MTEEITTWVPSGAAGAFNSTLKLPLAGLRIYNAALIVSEGRGGFYWTSSTFGSNRSIAIEFFGTTVQNNLDGFRGYGGSVRCIKD